ncbi:MAG: NAD-dependent epimerase/dehydratase family protein [Planctomycetota bacterium]|nr:MAG: NAD-dependent epimerase/dehydratase family protein [Planctomycetota bacterium]
MKVLVTGGAGFIGSHLSERLLARGDEVTVLDNFNDFYDPAIKRRNASALAAAGQGARIVEGDIRDQGLVQGLFDEGEFDAVAHLAAMAGVRPSLDDPLLYEEVNVRGTLILLEQIRRHEGQRFVFASSSSVYGGNDAVPFKETDDIPRPVSPYAATKRAGELMAYTHHHLYGIPTTCLRFFTVYGPRQRPEMAIHKFVRAILAGEPLPFFGDGSSRRDYTYVDDIVDGVVAAIDRCAGYEIYNLGESATTSLAELVGLIGEVCGREPVIDRRPVQPGDVEVTYADVSKARAGLGYDPKTTVRDGLERFLAWYHSSRRQA